MVQISRKSPDRFIHKALDIIRTGFGQPSCFNTEAIIQELLRQGKSIADARNGGASGCVETGAFGTEAYWLTGISTCENSRADLTTVSTGVRGNRSDCRQVHRPFSGPLMISSGHSEGR